MLFAVDGHILYFVEVKKLILRQEFVFENTLDENA